MIDTPSDRYRRDAEFATLVNLIYSWVERCQYTPTEVREAAVLAAVMYEQRRNRVWVLTAAEAERWGISIKEKEPA